jgi:hypothetical protein
MTSVRAVPGDFEPEFPGGDASAAEVTLNLAPAGPGTIAQRLITCDDVRLASLLPPIETGRMDEPRN